MKSHYQNKMLDLKKKQNLRRKHKYSLKRKCKRNYLIKKEKKN